MSRLGAIGAVPIVLAASFLLSVAQAGEPAGGPKPQKEERVLQQGKAPAAETQETDPRAKLASVMKWAGENAFLCTLLFVVILALLSAGLSRRVKDRCLRNFDGYKVCMELKDGTHYDGRFSAESTGFELIYDAPAEEPGEEVSVSPTSFILYQNEYNKLFAILRFADVLPEKEKKRRDKHVKGVFHPGVLRRASRRIRNFFASVKDSLMETITLFIGRMKNAGPQAGVFKTQEKYISKLGTEMVNVATDYSYDPMLERMIGHRVLLEVSRGDGTVTEVTAVFKEYSGGFMELIDAEYNSTVTVELENDLEPVRHCDIEISRQREGLVVENKGAYPVHIDSLTCRIESSVPKAADGETSEEMFTVKNECPPGARIEVPLPERKAGLVKVVMIQQRTADILVPRATAVIRHKADVHKKEIFPFL